MPTALRAQVVVDQPVTDVPGLLRTGADPLKSRAEDGTIGFADPEQPGVDDDLEMTGQAEMRQFLGKAAVGVRDDAHLHAPRRASAVRTACADGSSSQ